MTLINVWPIFDALHKTDDLNKPPPGLDGRQECIAVAVIDALIHGEPPSYPQVVSDEGKAKVAAFHAKWKTASEEERRAMADELRQRQAAEDHRRFLENPNIIY